MNPLRYLIPPAWGIGSIISLGLIVDNIDYPEPKLRIAGGFLLVIFIIIGLGYLMEDVK